MAKEEEGIRCRIVDPKGREVFPGYKAFAPARSMLHIGKEGFADDEFNRVRITLDDGTIIYGDECWWEKI